MVNPILGETELSRTPFARRPVARPGTALVFRMPDGTLTQEPFFPAGEWFKGPVAAYVVDVSTHRGAFEAGLPAEGDGDLFDATVEFTWHVSDPVIVVREQVTDPRGECRAALRRHLAEITGAFALTAPHAAQAAVVRTLEREGPFLIHRGLRIDGIRVHLTIPPDRLNVAREQLYRQRSQYDMSEYGRPWSGAAAHGGPPSGGQRSPSGGQQLPSGGEQLPSGGQRSPSGGQQTPSRRVLVGRMPAQVRDGSEVSLVVHIARSVPDGPRARSAVMSDFPIPAQGSDVTIVVHADSGLVPLLPEQQVIRVPAVGDPDPVRFAFRTHGIDVRRVEVTAWAGGKFLAGLDFEVSVTDRGPAIEPATKTAAIGTIEAADGAVTLQVHRSDDRYTFQLHNNQRYFDPVVVTVRAGADGILDRALETLRRFAKDVSPPPYPPAVARDWLRSLGVSLWESVVPEVIREQYLLVHHRIRTFSIATGDAVPWELLYPMTRTHDAGFLVDQFPVTRTVANTDRSRRITLGGATFVAGARPSSHTDAEFEAIGRIVSPGSPPAVVRDLGGLLDLLGSGHAGMTHFACHATYRADGTGAAIAMPDGEFTPMMLAAIRARESLADRRPLVFINACRSAGAVPYFTRMMGWAHQFVGAGAGAFVGTLWDVRSESAKHFAERFYAGLAGGRTLGTAALLARREIADDLDPTWLAYTVYGDPDALAHDAGGNAL